MVTESKQTPEEWRKNLANWLHAKLPDLTENEQESVIGAFVEAYDKDKRIILLFALSYLLTMASAGSPNLSRDFKERIYGNLRRHISMNKGGN